MALNTFGRRARFPPGVGRFPPEVSSVPIYDFLCRTCRHEFEAIVRHGDVPECPECHGRDLERLLSNFAVSSPEKRRAVAALAR